MSGKRVSEMTDDEIRELAGAVPEGIRSAADVVVFPEDLCAIRDAFDALLTTDRVVVNRQDLCDALTVISLWVPPEFRPSIILDRLSAAVSVERKRIPMAEVDEYHKCGKPDCTRLVSPASIFCCWPCSVASENGYELAFHSLGCDARDAERRPVSVPGRSDTGEGEPE